jgi:hypothetical protein
LAAAKKDAAKMMTAMTAMEIAAAVEKIQVIKVI